MWVVKNERGESEERKVTMSREDYPSMYATLDYVNWLNKRIASDEVPLR